MESRLDPGIAQAIRSRSRRHGVRVVLLRRPLWAATTVRTLFLVHTDPDHSWIERLEIDRPASLLTLDLSVLAAHEPPGIGARSPGIHLVCTNGRHDRCCADLGRPVVRALTAGGTADVWECSHIGGDRFAANLVCLPTGVYFGRVPPERAAGMADDLSRGLVDLDHFRGRSCFPPLVQAAEIFARRELGERRLDALRVVSTTARGEDSMTVVMAGDDGRHLDVTVARTRGSSQQLICAGDSEGRPWRYSLEGIELRRSREDRPTA